MGRPGSLLSVRLHLKSLLQLLARIGKLTGSGLLITNSPRQRKRSNHLGNYRGSKRICILHSQLSNRFRKLPPERIQASIKSLPRGLRHPCSFAVERCDRTSRFQFADVAF